MTVVLGFVCVGITVCCIATRLKLLAPLLARSSVHCADVDVIREGLSVEWQVHELELISFLSVLEEAHQVLGLGPHVQLVPLPKVLADVTHQYLVKYNRIKCY